MPRVRGYTVTVRATLWPLRSSTLRVIGYGVFVFIVSSPALQTLTTTTDEAGVAAVEDQARGRPAAPAADGRRRARVHSWRAREVVERGTQGRVATGEFCGFATVGAEGVTHAHPAVASAQTPAVGLRTIAAHTRGSKHAVTSGRRSES